MFAMHVDPVVYWWIAGTCLGMSLGMVLPWPGTRPCLWKSLIPLAAGVILLSCFEAPAQELIPAACADSAYIRLQHQDTLSGSDIALRDIKYRECEDAKEDIRKSARIQKASIVIGIFAIGILIFNLVLVVT